MRSDPCRPDSSLVLACLPRPRGVFARSARRCRPAWRLLRRWSTLLDSVFAFPGSGIRFGWDPILGLVPGLGDVVTPLFSVAIVVTGMQLGMPRVVQLRMLLNVAIDAVVGAVPLVGDAFDVAWKANDRNMRLLERHAWEERPPSRGDWLFVVAIARRACWRSIAMPIVTLLVRACGGWQRGRV